jgi:hypothetical protein
MRVAGGALALAASCGGEPPSAPVETGGTAAWFVEDAAARGLVFEHRSGHGERFLFPELMGGGAALFDMDGDGDLDAFLVQSGSLFADAQVDHALFENRGDGTFVDVSAERGVRVGGYGMGVATGDYDGDGDVDLYVTCVGPNKLLRNTGSGHFEEVGAAAGVADAGWGTSACFFDYDGDTDLDLYVANYVDWSIETEIDCFDPTGKPDYCGPSAYDAPSRDALFRNDGDGRFTDVTEALGVAAARGNGLGVVPGDFDGDGRCDLFVANDQTADLLWVHRDGLLVNVAETAGCARSTEGRMRAGMGVDAADVDGDDDLDLLVVHIAQEMDGFFQNQGGHFVERTARAGIGTSTYRMTRFGVGFVDFDNDGWMDVYVANGRVNLMLAALKPDDPYAEPNTLLRGTPEGRWTLVEPAGGTAAPLVETSRGAAFGDVDGDGGIDVLVVNRDAPAHLFMNTAPARGHWLRLRLVENGRDALGASARITLDGRTLRREAKCGYSYCSASAARPHFGLGDARTVDEVRVRWPDGAEERFGPFAADREEVLVRGRGR